MRATEFLVEYNRQITAKNYGKKLYDRTKKDRSWHNFYYVFPESKYLSPEQQAELIIANLEQVDPTPNKEYMQWIVRTYIKEPNFWVQDLFSTIKDYLIKFHRLKRRKMLPYPRSDINEYDSFADFMGVVDEYDDPSIQQQLYSSDYRVIYEDNILKAFVPLSQDAACYLGQGTRWCTAATRSKNYFDDYNQQSPLLILIPKKPQHNGEKYQLHFGSGQFMNEDDDPVSLDELIVHRFNLLPFFTKVEPEIKNFVICFCIKFRLVVEVSIIILLHLSTYNKFDVMKNTRDC